jgi:hypothetical protein
MEAMKSVRHSVIALTIEQYLTEYRTMTVSRQEAVLSTLIKVLDRGVSVQEKEKIQMVIKALAVYEVAVSRDHVVEKVRETFHSSDVSQETRYFCAEVLGQLVGILGDLKKGYSGFPLYLIERSLTNIQKDLLVDIDASQSIQMTLEAFKVLMDGAKLGAERMEGRFKRVLRFFKGDEAFELEFLQYEGYISIFYDRVVGRKQTVQRVLVYRGVLDHPIDQDAITGKGLVDIIKHMVDPGPLAAGRVKNGGIDIRDIHVERKEAGQRTLFNDRAMWKVLEDGFSGFSPVIINIIPIESPLPLLGVN